MLDVYIDQIFKISPIQNILIDFDQAGEAAPCKDFQGCLDCTMCHGCTGRNALLRNSKDIDNCILNLPISIYQSVHLYTDIIEKDI